MLLDIRGSRDISSSNRDITGDIPPTRRFASARTQFVRRPDRGSIAAVWSSWRVGSTITLGAMIGSSDAYYYVAAPRLVKKCAIPARSISIAGAGDRLPAI